MGNLSREKNPGAALAVTERLGVEQPVELRIVGEGPLLEALRTQADELGIATHVSFAGSVEDVGPHLAWADLLLLTSETEGLPGVVIEAAAAGVPAVAFDVGGTSETIDPGVTGLLVPAGDFDSLAGAVRELQTDRNRLRHMGAMARELALKRYALDRAVDHYEKLLSSDQG
jgi:glycosyltransferase involved in cell wall biosynthesis